MSDLCAPVYVVMGSDEELTFWCFVEVMNRMVSNLVMLTRGTSTQVICRHKTSFEIKAA